MIKNSILRPGGGVAGQLEYGHDSDCLYCGQCLHHHVSLFLGCLQTTSIYCLIGKSHASNPEEYSE
jgi:hypothetical protein